MAKSLSQLKSQIQRLQKEVTSIEVGVVARIKKEIIKHGLTVEHLFGSSPAAAPAASTPSKSAVKPGAKFADEHGNSWSGFGPKPGWIREALAAGRSIQDLQSGTPQFAAPAKAQAATTAVPKGAKTPKFADGAGNTWGGMGKRPDWLRAALDSGQSLDEFLVTKSRAVGPAKSEASVASVVEKPLTKATAPAKKAARPALAAKPAAKDGKTAAPAEKLAAKAKPKAAPTAKKSVVPKSAIKAVSPLKAAPSKAPAAEKVAAAKVAKTPAATPKKAKAKSAQPTISTAAEATKDAATAADASRT